MIEIKSWNDIIITNKKLGFGGLANVYLGYFKKNNSYLAIKEIDINKIHPKDINNINKEISNHLWLNNNNIIKFYNKFQIKNKLFIILEYAEKGNLFNYIHKIKSKLNDIEIAKIINELVSALEYIHSKNIIHRDIKPENLLLDDNLNIKLADFGWCSKLSKCEKRLSYCGTLEYMAPEILENKPQDYYIDIWSIGVLLYELYHKKSPFTNMNPVQMIDIIKNKNYKFSETINLDAKNLILNILCYNKEDRLGLKEIKSHPFILKNINFQKKISCQKKHFSKKINIINDNCLLINKNINSVNKSVTNKYFFKNNNNKMSKFNVNLNKNYPQSNNKIIKVTTSVDKSSYNFYKQKVENKKIENKNIKHFNFFPIKSINNI